MPGRNQDFNHLASLLDACEAVNLPGLEQLLCDPACKNLAAFTLAKQLVRACDPRVLALLMKNVKPSVAELCSVPKVEQRRLLSYEPYAKELAVVLTKAQVKQINHPVLTIFSKLHSYAYDIGIFNLKNHAAFARQLYQTPNLTLKDYEERITKRFIESDTEITSKSELGKILRLLRLYLFDFEKVAAMTSGEKNALFDQDLQAKKYASVWENKHIETIQHKRLSSYFHLMEYASFDLSTLNKVDHSGIVLSLLADDKLKLEDIREKIVEYCDANQLGERDSLRALANSLPQYDSYNVAPVASLEARDNFFPV